MLILLSFLVPMLAFQVQTDCPVKGMVAYSRETTSGIPGPQPRAIQTSYYLYVLVERGTQPSPDAGVWLQGKFYAATLRKVTPPVVIARDPAVSTGEMDTLVGETAADVFQVELGEEKAWRPGDPEEKALTERNEAVVFLKVGRAVCPCPAKEIKALRPAPGM